MAMDRSANLWIYFNSVFLVLSVWTLASSALTEAPNDVCADGTYQHEGVTCCLCARGQKVLKHCTKSPDDGECGFCEEGKTYREEPTSETTCEPCRSCSHPNAHLEVVEHCTSSRNAKCECQKGYYCDSKESCMICHSCDICEFGIQIACNGTSNTVCNGRQDGSTGTIVGVVIVIVILILGIVVGVILHQKKKKGIAVSGKDEPDSEELDYLNEVNIVPHLPDIAQVLGWKDMLFIARKSQLAKTAIDSCQLNHPNDTEESTFELLQKWLEHEGSSGLRSLVQVLQKSGKREKKEKILKLVKPDGNNESRNPV